VGTLIGNGQWLGQANWVAVPESQAESLSEMTMHRGQSFYATLIALGCSIRYLVGRTAVNRLQAAVIRTCRSVVREHLQRTL
jgi:hypothetical protein